MNGIIVVVPTYLVTVKLKRVCECTYPTKIFIVVYQAINLFMVYEEI